jgi:hypothetical protein
VLLEGSLAAPLGVGEVREERGFLGRIHLRKGYASARRSLDVSEQAGVLRGPGLHRA